MKLKNYALIFLFALLIVSCAKKDSPFVPVTLQSSSEQVSRAAGDLQTFIGSSGIILPSGALQYGTDLYTITYQTTYQGNTVTASAVVILPQTSTPVGMVCFNHGTIAAHSEAPSVQPLNSTEWIFYSALASPGFIAVIPDFLGFGSSASILHPYYVEDATAVPVMDAMKAARELAIQKGKSFNGKLFIAGYSQGGYVTMATHKAIETNGLPNFNLVASFPSSGGYDVKGMQSYFWGLATYDEPFFLAYVAMAYRTYYNWTRPLTDVFQSKYASVIPGLFDGTQSGDQINAALNDTIPKLITPDILANINTSVNYQYITTAFNENSLLDWYPKVKMYMYHGDADITVPYQNSVNTYNKLIANGASTSVLTFTTLPGATHATGVVPYIEKFIPTLLSLK